MVVALLACVPAANDSERSRGGSDPEMEPMSPDTLASGVGRDDEHVSSLLARYDFEDRTHRFDLPGRLDEISGLAFAPDGRLFAHDDERARIHTIDVHTGQVGARFDLGAELIRDDFEGIAIVDERFFLVTSTGILYEFREGSDEEDVAFRRTDTGLGRGCEIEGLDHDAARDALVFACKRAQSDRDAILLPRIPLDPSAPRIDPIRIARADVARVGLDPDFQPSALVVDPSGSILLASAVTEALLEIDASGSVLNGAQLRRGRHPQPEGIEIGPDGALYIADEKNGQDARLSVYALSGGGS